VPQPLLSACALLLLAAYAATAFTGLSAEARARLLGVAPQRARLPERRRRQRSVEDEIRRFFGSVAALAAAEAAVLGLAALRG
jgi:hypothetical protein